MITNVLYFQLRLNLPNIRNKVRHLRKKPTLSSQPYILVLKSGIRVSGWKVVLKCDKQVLFRVLSKTYADRILALVVKSQVDEIIKTSNNPLSLKQEMLFMFHAFILNRHFKIRT